MKVGFSRSAWEDYCHWQVTDKAIIKKLNALISDTIKHPLTGIGKPEALKHNLQGCYSRRINQEHRFVYRVKGDLVEVISVKYHYK